MHSHSHECKSSSGLSVSMNITWNIADTLKKEGKHIQNALMLEWTLCNLDSISVEFISLVQSGFLEEDQTGLLWEAWEWFMDHLKTSPQWLQLVFKKTGPKPLKNQSKPLKTFFLHFIDVFHIKGMSDSI